jgi:hypothetical protein
MQSRIRSARNQRSLPITMRAAYSYWPSETLNLIQLSKGGPRGWRASHTARSKDVVATEIKKVRVFGESELAKGWSGFTNVPNVPQRSQHRWESGPFDELPAANGVARTDKPWPVQSSKAMDSPFAKDERMIPMPAMT